MKDPERDRRVNGDDGLAVFGIGRIDGLRDSTHDTGQEDATGCKDSQTLSRANFINGRNPLVLRFCRS
jgi:hypothetical protein